MPDIDSIIFWVVVIDALVVLAFGLAAAVVQLLDLNVGDLVGRIPPALFVLVLSSLGCCGLLWGADFVAGVGNVAAVSSIVFYGMVLDALVLLAFGLGAAAVTLFNIKTEGLLDRIPGALAALVLSSLGCCALLWGAGYLIGG